MEQAELRQWERKCIQEEPARCVAACPLHVDAKGFCALMAQRRWDKAWQVLAKTLPLPGVLARLCHGPCMEACVRKDAGGAVNMAALERFCADAASPVPPPRPLPSRGKGVAVLGHGFTALCAAWEMARRGFDVTLFCEDAMALGAELLSLPAGVLPEGALDRELEALRTLGATVREARVDAALLETLLAEQDAVFVDSDHCPELANVCASPDELTLGTDTPGLFCAPAGQTRFILQAATARRAANSLERFTQGVSMVTGREQEGPYPTRLFTSLQHVPPVEPVPAGEGYGEPEARDEARRCLQCECMECVKVCEYLKHYKSYPKVYARRIYNNESIVMGTRQANKMINSCMLCGLCEVVCPEDFAMADLCLQARRTMVERNTMPPSAHEFALRDMAFANGPKAALARHAPGADRSDYVFFPGCQLTACGPELVEAAYADLRRRLDRVGLMLHCCGAPAEWSGRQRLMDEVMGEIAEQWRSLGSPVIITACPTCHNMLRQRLEGAEIVTHWSLLRALGLPDGPNSAERPREGRAHGPLAVNDPCAARHQPMVREDVRAVLESLGVECVEPELTGERTECCGYGGLLSDANPELGRAVSERRASAAEEDWVTYCAMCRDMIARTGKRALHVYDLLYPAATGSKDPAARPRTGFSARRENRARLQETLLREFWDSGDEVVKEPHESVAVEFSAEAARAMEERRILKSDVQKVLLEVGRSGRRFRHRDTGRFLAAHRPVTVTYWVEYALRDDVHVVHNVWSHRMRVREVAP